MAHTWGHLGRELIGGWLGDGGGGGGVGITPFVDPTFQTPTGGTMMPSASAGYSGGSCPPRKTRTLTIDCATGLEIKRIRRRRRKMLTEGDMAQLFQIATLPNNANVRTALARAVRR